MYAGKGQSQMILASINSVFAWDRYAAAIEQRLVVADPLRADFSKVAVLGDNTEPDLLAVMVFQKANRGNPRHESVGTR